MRVLQLASAPAQDLWAKSPFFFSSLLFFFFIFSLFFFSFHAFMAFIHGSFFHLHHCLHHCHDWIFGTCSGDLHTWHQDQLWSPSHFSLKFFSLFSKQNCKKKNGWATNETDTLKTMTVWPQEATKAGRHLGSSKSQTHWLHTETRPAGWR